MSSAVSDSALDLRSIIQTLTGSFPDGRWEVVRANSTMTIDHEALCFERDLECSEQWDTCVCLCMHVCLCVSVGLSELCVCVCIRG